MFCFGPFPNMWEVGMQGFCSKQELNDISFFFSFLLYVVTPMEARTKIKKERKKTNKNFHLKNDIVIEI